MLKKIKQRRKQKLIMRLIDEIEVFAIKTNDERCKDLKERGYTDKHIRSIEAEAWVFIMEAARELGNK